jgi:transposase-like protein
LYGTEQQCERALVAARWPHGWQCAHCGCKRSFMTRNGHGRQLWECLICGYQSSSIVGTVMEHTKLPLTLWFLAMYLLTQHKNAISALALKRQLGVSYKTAWRLLHKLMQTMGLRDASYRLQGRVEIDDAYLGGERAGSINGGRKAANKTAFIAAVQTRPDGRALYMHLTPVADFTNQDLRQWAERHLASGWHVTGGGRQGAQTPQLHWVNTLLGNLKTSMAGTYHTFDHARYAARYLGEFAYRFNRRFDLPAMLPRLLRAVASTKPLPLKLLRLSEACS